MVMTQKWGIVSQTYGKILFALVSILELLINAVLVWGVTSAQVGCCLCGNGLKAGTECFTRVFPSVEDSVTRCWFPLPGVVFGLIFPKTGSPAPVN